MASEIDLDFDWDEDKAASNLKKHGISFEEAKTVFGDPFSVTLMTLHIPQMSIGSLTSAHLLRV